MENEIQQQESVCVAIAIDSYDVNSTVALYNQQSAPEEVLMQLVHGLILSCPHITFNRFSDVLSDVCCLARASS